MNCSRNAEKETTLVYIDLILLKIHYLIYILAFHVLILLAYLTYGLIYFGIPLDTDILSSLFLILAIFYLKDSFLPKSHNFADVESLFKGNSLSKQLRQCAFCICMLLTVLIFYNATNAALRIWYRTTNNQVDVLWDSTLIKIDSWILDPLFNSSSTHGQISLFLDQTEHLIVSWKMRLAVECLQILYTSFYIFGASIFIILMSQYLFTYQQRETTITTIYSTCDKHLQTFRWYRVLQFICAWVSTQESNLLLNLMFPAVSPRIYLKHIFQNELQGLWIYNNCRQFVEQAAAHTFTAFPSAHSSLTWIIAFMLYRFGWHKPAAFAFCYAVLISIATLVLRYHYFMDFIMSFIPCTIGMSFGLLTKQTAKRQQY